MAVLIALLHLFWYGIHIGDAELWLDESSTYGIAARSLGTIFTLPTEFHSQPPLYYLVLHFIMKVNSERWFIRGLSWFSCFLILQFVLFYFHELNLMARLLLCALFLQSAVFHYLSSSLRPYGMAAFLTLVSTVMLTRMARDPSRRRAAIYVAWTLPMLYTMAFDIGVFLGHGAFMLLAWIADLSHGPRAFVRHQRWAVVAMAACAVGYLPYVLLAYHYQFQPNSSHNLHYALTLAAYTGPSNEILGFSESSMVILYTLVGIALVAALLRREPSALAWLAVFFLEIAFVWIFIPGRSVVGMQGRYLTPGYVAILVLAPLGFQELAARTRPAAWIGALLLLLWYAWPAAKAFHTALHTPAPVGTWAALHREMRTHPGKKVIFFYIGYSGQDFEYEVRDDPSVIVGTMRGHLLASGGDNHLDPAYVSGIVDRTQAE
ncbi:MAG TPA: hypothetical protein VHV78_18110, partial [Gemmatimonadaceae bacterium]|nr:hypothetical protein [Gemmatimonadaceae bacterium]